MSVPFDRRVWQESRALANDGYEVHVVCPQDEQRDTESYVELEGVHLHRFPLKAATGGRIGYAREYATALVHMMRLAFRLGWRLPFDVVHACNPPDLLFLIALPLKLRGSSFVFDHHDLVPELILSRFGNRRGVLYWWSRLLERFTFASADAVIATNESYRRVALTRGRQPPERVEVVRNGPDLSRFGPVPALPALKRGRRYLLCYLGVMGYQDGVDYALRAIARLRHDLDRDDFHAAFIGAGDAFEDNVALAHSLELDGCVEFLGRVPDGVVQKYLSTADVCLAPDPSSPLNDVSTMTKIMEYMAMSRPVVSFDLSESRISAGDAAVYARGNDEREFARLIAMLLDDSIRRAEMGRIGRERVERELSWGVSEQRLLELYRRLTSA